MDYVGFDCKRTVPLQSFLALSHSSSHARASALTSPPPDFLFISIHRTPPSHKFPPFHPKKRNNPYWYCPLCTPALTLPPSSLKCLQKSNPNIHRKCFKCFKCFGCFRCFISLLDHKTARFWSKSEQNPKNVTIQLCNNMGALSVGMLF